VAGKLVPTSLREATHVHHSSSTLLLPFQPSSMTSAHLAAVSYLARYSGERGVLGDKSTACTTRRLDTTSTKRASTMSESVVIFPDPDQPSA
jgi:hypothetical protein